MAERMMLILMAGLALILSVQGRSVPVYGYWPSAINGQYRSQSDGSIELTVTVTQGNPQPDTFNWTLPDGSVLLPGRTKGVYEARPASDSLYGGKTFVLKIGADHTFTQATVKFMASASGRWTKGYTYSITSRRVPRNFSYPRITADTKYNSDKSILLSASVSGGYPRPNSFWWELPDGTRLTPGDSNGSFRAYQLMGHFMVNSPSVSSLLVKDGLLTSAQLIVFKASYTGAGGYTSSLRFRLPAKSAVVARRAGEVSYRIQYGQQSVKITAEILGGTPPPNTYEWKVRQGGSYAFTSYKPGEGPTSAISTSATGNPVTVLTLPYSRYHRSYAELHVSSQDEGKLLWYAYGSWRV